MAATWVLSGASYAAGFVDRECVVRVRGEVASVRRISKAITFVDLAHVSHATDGSEGGSIGAASTGENLQVVFNLKICVAQADQDLCRTLRKGDWIVCTGHPGRTRTGTDTDISLFATSVTVDSFELSDSSRVVALLGDAAHGRTNAQRLGQQMGVSPALFASLTKLLKKPIQRRESSIAKSNATGVKRKASNHDSSGDAADTGERWRTVRRTRLEAVAQQKQHNLFIVLEGTSKISNVAAIMRTCDALGVTKLLLVSPQVDGLSASCNSEHGQL